MIASNPGEFGFGGIEYHDPLIYDEVEIISPLDLDVAAECAGTTIDEIKRLNPELRRWCTPPDAERYVLKVPEGTREMFMEKLSAVPEGERFTIDRYTVRKGIPSKVSHTEPASPCRLFFPLMPWKRSCA